MSMTITVVEGTTGPVVTVTPLDAAQSAALALKADVTALTAETTARGAADTAHGVAADPHAGYRLESVPITAAMVAADVATQAELDAVVAAQSATYVPLSQRDANSGYPGLAAAQGARNGTKFLRDDGTWQTVSGGGGTAAATTFTPAGTVAATNVQAAIVEVEGDALSRTLRALRRASSILRAPPVTNRSTWYQQGASAVGVLSANFRSRRTAIGAASDLRFVYANGYVFEAVIPTNNITVRCAIELPDGTRHALYFGGKRDVVIEPTGIAVSDPVAVDIAAGDVCYARTFVTVPTGGTFPTGDSNLGQAGEGGDAATNATDQTLVGTTAATSVFHFGPLAVLGVPTVEAPVVAGIGDSIMMGQGDTQATAAAASGRGFFERALNNQYPFLKLASSGETANNFNLQAGHKIRLTLVAGCTHAIVEYGVNDMVGGTTVALLQGYVLGIATKLAARGVVVYQTTITPKSASPDSWMTEAAQTPDATVSPIRTPFNAWLRAGAPVDPTTKAAVAIGTSGALLAAVYGTTGALVTAASGSGHPITGILDCGGAVEGAIANTWKQDPSPRTVSDATTNAGTLITSASANFVAGDIGKTVKIIGGGTGGADFYSIIYARDSATNARISPSSPLVLSGLTMTIFKSMTSDGTHPIPVGHTDMAAAIPVATIFVLP